MKVKCTSLFIVSDQNRNEPYQQLLQLNKEILVYGIFVRNGVVNYLTMDKYNERPYWNPAELFEVVDNKLSCNWLYKFYGYEVDGYINAVFGYPELLDKKHYIGLLEREEEDMKIFNFRKKEIDNEFLI